MDEMVSETEAAPQRGSFTWLELCLYPVLVLGLFFVAGLGLGQIITGGTILAMVVTYGLNLAIFAGAALVLGVWRGKITWAELGIAPLRWRWVWLLLAIGVTIVLLPLRGIIGLIVQLLLGGGLEALQGRYQMLAGTGFSWTAFLLTLLGAGVIAPIAEEFFFRGFLYTAFRRRTGFLGAALLSSLAFAIGHIDALGVVAASFVMGIVLALMYEYTRSLWVTIVAHAINNAIAVVVLYLALALGLVPPAS
jgi:membrane protease YdiL (CAAX protease family)